MPTWITGVLVPLTILCATLTANFYFKWVPDVEEQKRHLRAMGGWLIDILALVSSCFWLYGFTQRKAAVTPGFVVEVSLAAVCLCSVVLLVLAERILSSKTCRKIFEVLTGHLSVTTQSVDALGTLAMIAERHTQALARIAEDSRLSRATQDALQEILQLETATTTNPKQPEEKKQLRAGS